MKTINKLRNNSITILLFLTTILLPLISKAQLNLNSTGGVSVSGGTVPTTGLIVGAGDINLNTSTNSFKIAGSRYFGINIVKGILF